MVRRLCLPPSIDEELTKDRLYRINALEEPSDGPVQKKEYIYYNMQIGKHNSTYSSGFSIQDMPVSSAIMAPVDKNVIVHDGKIKVHGWAYSGGGHWPERVEVSGDGTFSPGVHSRGTLHSNDQ